MRFLYVSILSFVSVTLLACVTVNNSMTINTNGANSNQNWGFILVEPGALASNKAPDKDYINGIIGYGGFSDEASCMLEAKKRLNEQPDRPKLEAKCFDPFPLSSFEPYKIAQAH